MGRRVGGAAARAKLEELGLWRQRVPSAESPLADGALAREEATGPARAGWVRSTSPAGKPCALLGSAATLLASLSLHAGGAAFGVLPTLDAFSNASSLDAEQLYALEADPLESTNLRAHCPR